MIDKQSDYKSFLANKVKTVEYSGFEVAEESINPKLFKFQKDIVRWALKLGKAALFEECGLGKTAQQLEWAKHVAAHTSGKVLILAPLAVAYQTVEEGEKFGIPVKQVKDQSEVGDSNIVITNYDRLHLMDSSQFKGVVLDESSILKSFMGKTKRAIFEAFKNTPYKLACTATPAPNDHLELGNHAAFLDVMPANEMISRWFINDTMEAGNYRLKEHAAKDFWRWLTSWAVCLSRPGDLGAGYDMPSFNLPELKLIEHRLSAPKASIDRAWEEGRLLPDDSPSSTGMHKVKKESLKDRVAKAVEVVGKEWGIEIWYGNLNTPNDDVKNIRVTQKNEKNGNLKDEHQKKTKSTWQNTIKTINNDYQNMHLKGENAKTLSDESDMQPIQNTEKNANQILGLTDKPNLSENSNMSTVSHLKNTNSDLNNSQTNAQSAEWDLQNTGKTSHTSIMTTTPGQSEDFSVQNVTLDLESFEITPTFSEMLSCISTNQANPPPFIIWCDTDYEQRALEGVFGDVAISIYGTLSTEEKERRVLDFIDLKKPILISKPSILGFGMNFQHCANQTFVGVSYSFEKTYQALHRSYRFGQAKPVYAHLIYAETEGNILTILKQKQEMFKQMQSEMNTAMHEHGLFRDNNRLKLTTPDSKIAKGENWTMILGDCVTETAKLPSNSIDFGIHSPPFANLYIYSDSEADMGNSADDDEFFTHYQYLIKELLRVTVPGRLCAVHCKDLPSYMNRDGAAGLVDFPGRIIRAFEEAVMDSEKDLPEEARSKWQYHSRITIWKDPVIEMQRTKNHGLLHKNFTSTADACRQGMPDYMIVFRKWPLDGGKPVKQKRVPGDYIGTEPPTIGDISGGTRSMDDNYSIAVWQRYASPVWFDIDQTNVLNYQMAKDSEDEKHICPLQLDVIARCVDLWTNKGDTVLSPFAGIGSEGYESIKLGRKFIGIELKEAYWKHAQRYLADAERIANTPDLFSWAASQAENQSA